MKIKKIVNTIGDPAINDSDLPIDNLIDFLMDAKHFGATHVHAPLDEYAVVM